MKIKYYSIRTFLIFILLPRPTATPSKIEGELSRRNFVNWLAEYPMLCKKIRIFAENSIHEEPLVYPIAPVHFLRRECLERAGDKRETTSAVFL